MSDQPMSSTRMTMMFGRESRCAADATRKSAAAAMAAKAAAAPSSARTPIVRRVVLMRRNILHRDGHRYLHPFHAGAIPGHVPEARAGSGNVPPLDAAQAALRPRRALPADGRVPGLQTGD